MPPIVNRITLSLALLTSALSFTNQANADHWHSRPRTVVGFSISLGTPIVPYPPPVVVYDPYRPVLVSPRPVIIVDPCSPPPIYYRPATGVYLSPGFGFYYERYR